MIAYSMAPRDFDQTAFSSKIGTWAKSTYLGRDVFGPVTTDYPQGYLYVCSTGYNQVCVPLTNSTATDPVVSRHRVGVAFQTLALADGDALTFASWYICSAGGANQVMEDFQIVRAGSAYSIRLKHGAYGYSTLVSGVVPGVFYRVGVDLYKDLAKPWANGAFLANIAGGSAYADRAYSLNFLGHVKFQPWYDGAQIYHGHDGTGSSLATVNDLPADGEAVWIKKAYLSAGLAGGDVVKAAIAAGVVASTPSADGDWLQTAQLGQNNFGGSKRVNRASGVWTDLDWSI